MYTVHVYGALCVPPTLNHFLVRINGHMCAHVLTNNSLEPGPGLSMLFNADKLTKDVTGVVLRPISSFSTLHACNIEKLGWAWE